MTARFKAFVRSNWSTGVAGLRNTAGRVATSTGWVTSRQVDDLSRALFQAGDQFNASLIDGLADCVRADGLTRNVSTVLGLSTDTTRLLLPDPDGRAARQELLNKVEVFRLVRYEQPDGTTAGRDEAALREVVARAYDRDAHRALWIAEGMAHRVVAARLARGGRPRALFVQLPAGLPESSRPMLHAGLGLAAAEYLLERYVPRKDDADALLREFIALCRDNSDPAFLDTALEALGLVARCFYPESVPPLSAAVERLGASTGAAPASEFYDYWWHGVGRGTYFVPLSFVPGYGAIGRAIDTVKHEAPDAAAADAALAGLAYAFNMVNMGHPEVLASLLRQRGASLAGGAFARGLLAAFVARLEVTPDYPLLQIFLDHRPERAEALWEEMVRRPCRQVLAATTEDQRRAVLGEIYRSLGGRNGAA